MKGQRMRLGGVYVNACSSEDNPHRMGLYIGWIGKAFELLHDDGRRSQFDDFDSLVYGGIQLFDRGRLRQWFANAKGRTNKEARGVAARIRRDAQEAAFSTAERTLARSQAEKDRIAACAEELAMGSCKC